MRGSSSPVELRRARDENNIPATVPRSTVNLPQKTPEMEADLEEGEVISPVKRVETDLRLHQDDRPPKRDRWSSPEWGRPNHEAAWRWARHSTSPQKRSRQRTPTTWDRAADLSDGRMPRGRRRSVSSPVDQRRLESLADQDRPPPSGTEGSPQSLQEESMREKRKEVDDRPLTPLDPPPVLDRKDPNLNVRIVSRAESPDAPPMTSSRLDTPGFPPPLDDLNTASPSALLRPATPTFPPPGSDLKPHKSALWLSMDLHDTQIHERSFGPLATAVSASGRDASVDVAQNSAQNGDETRFPDNREAASFQQFPGVGTAQGRNIGDETLSQQTDTTRDPHPPPSSAGRAHHKGAVQNTLDSRVSGAPANSVENVYSNPDSSPPTPVTPTSPSESATTPANGARRDSGDVEIVIDVSKHPRLRLCVS